MNKLFLLLLFPLTSLAQSSAKEFKIKGQLKLTKPVDWVYLRYTAGEETVFDSVQPKKGEFKFEGKIAEPVTANLMVKFVKQPGEEKAQRDFMQFFLQPAKIEITAKDSLKFTSVNGSVGNDEFSSLLKEQTSYNDQFEPLYKEYSERQMQGDKAGMKRVEDSIDLIDNQMNEKVFLGFFKTHSNSPVALYALKQYAGYDIDPARVEPLFNSLPANVRQWPSAKSFKSQIEIAKKTAVGNYAMDFTENDTLGKPVSLSSFRGKYVLVDFWASWCGPCRRENPNVVKAFNKLRNKNFTILSVSLDRSDAKEKWLAAIHKDSLTWNHVSDLKYWDNAVAKQYGIRAIPQNLLLDPKGKIIAKNLRGDDLESKLSELISN